jgi:hypothetical protein
MEFCEGREDVRELEQMVGSGADFEFQGEPYDEENRSNRGEIIEIYIFIGLVISPREYSLIKPPFQSSNRLHFHSNFQQRLC